MPAEELLFWPLHLQERMQGLKTTEKRSITLTVILVFVLTIALPVMAFAASDTAGLSGEGSEVKTTNSKIKVTDPIRTYTLKYDANGGTGAPDPQIVTTTAHFADFVISNNVPTRSGYKFLGWSPDANATSPDARYLQSEDNLRLEDGTTPLTEMEPVTFTPKITLYAVWGAPDPTSAATPLPAQTVIPSPSEAPVPTSTPTSNSGTATVAPGPSAKPTPSPSASPAPTQTLSPAGRPLPSHEPFFPMDDVRDIHAFYEMDASELAAIPMESHTQRSAPLSVASGARIQLNGATGLTTDMYGRELTSAFFFYRNVLNEEDQAMYDVICAAAMTGETEIPFRHPGSVNEPDKERLMNVVRSIRYDHPELFWLDESYSYGYGRRTDTNGTPYLQMKIVFQPYAELYTDLNSTCAEMEAAANKIIRFADEHGSNDAEKAKIVHDVLVDLIEYETDSPYNQSAYSAFVNRSTVCAGYAKAYQYCLQKLGIPCSYIVGDARTGDMTGLHAWSLVRLDDDLYIVDVTWDDTGCVDYTYFNLTDEQIGQDHFRKDASLLLPLAKGTKYSISNYFKDVKWTDTSPVESASDTLPMVPNTSPHVVKCDASDSGEVWTELNEATQGQILTLRATPDPGHRLWKWSIEYADTEIPLDVASADGISFMMPDDDVHVRAVFGSGDGPDPVPYGIKTPPALLGGSIEASVDTAMPGSTLELTAVPQEGYSLKTWGVTYGNNTTPLDTSTNHASFVMPDSNVTITAAFEDDEARETLYTVTVPEGVAKAGIAADPAQAHAGDDVELTVDLGIGYHLVSWGVEYGGTTTDLKLPSNNTITFAMPARDVTIVAKLESNVEQLQAAQPPDGVALAEDSVFGFWKTSRGDLILQGVVGGTATAGSLRNALSLSDGLTLELRAQNGESIPNEAALCTGDAVHIAGETGIVLDAIVIIKGDVIGTGKTSVAQLVRLANHFVSPVLEGIYLQAADLSGDGSVGLTDIVQAAQIFRAGPAN